MKRVQVSAYLGEHLLELMAVQFGDDVCLSDRRRRLQIQLWFKIGSLLETRLLQHLGES